MSVNMIGRFRFVSLSRPPEFAQQEIVTRTRAGVDGVTLQRVGKRAKPFQVTSYVDALSLNNALELYRQYTELVGEDAVQVYWANIPMGLINLWFYVTRVEPVDIRYLLLGVGGLNGLSYAKCECVWTLQPAIIEPPTT